MNLVFLTRSFTETEIADLLYRYFEYLNERNFIIDIFRTIGFWILKGLYYITQLAYEFFDSIAGLNYFFKIDAINNIYSKVALVTGSIIILYVVITSIKSIISMKLNKEIIKNAIISAVLIASLPFAMTKASELTVAGIKFIKSWNVSSVITDNPGKAWQLGGYEEYGNKKQETIVDNVFKNMFIDVKENLIDKDFKDVTKIEGNNLHIDDLKRIKINSMMLKDRVPIHKVLEYRLSGYGKEIEKISSNGKLVMSFRVEGYYRWKFNFIYGVVFMVLLLMVFLRSGFTIAKLIYELGLNKIISPLILSTDVETGEKRKVVIREIGICYMTIVVTYISVHLYSEFINFVNSIDISINSIQKIFLVAGATIGVIKGSNLVEKTFGIQSSHTSSLSSWIYTFSAMKNLVSSRSSSRNNSNSENTNSSNNNSDNNNELNNNSSNNNSSNATNEQFANKNLNATQDLNNYRNSSNDSNTNAGNSEDINSYRSGENRNSDDMNDYRNSDFNNKSNSDYDDINNYTNKNNVDFDTNRDYNSKENDNFLENKKDIWEEMKENKENRSEDYKNDYYKDKNLDNKNFWDNFKSKKD